METITKIGKVIAVVWDTERVEGGAVSAVVERPPDAHLVEVVGGAEAGACTLTLEGSAAPDGPFVHQAAALVSRACPLEMRAVPMWQYVRLRSDGGVTLSARIVYHVPSGMAYSRPPGQP